MSRRIEIELTSTKSDGSWTWRAAGARQPKGVVGSDLLPAGAAVGSVYRADIDTGLDGTDVLAVLPPKGARAEPERIELLGRADPSEWVTTTLAPKGRGRRDDRDRGERGDRRPRSDRGDRGDRGTRSGGPRREGGREQPGRERPGREQAGRERGPADRAGADRRPSRADGDNRGRSQSGPSRPRRERPAEDTPPRPKRLRAGRVHRRAVLDALPPEHRPIAERVLEGGIPAVRMAVDKQNEQARAEGKPAVKADQLVDLAEQLLPRLRTAEWRDRADAALADLDELDLRDLRSVIVAADSAARDDETRALANELREGLARRVEQEQANWLQEITTNLADGRIVRALSLSSRPPKAGVPLPADLSERLIAATTAALASDTPQARWATVIDALSFSPVHLKVAPASIPAEPDDALLAAVRLASSRIPHIAAMFGIAPTAPPPERRRPSSRPTGTKAKSKQGPRTKATPPATADKPAAEQAQATTSDDQTVPASEPPELAVDQAQAATSGDQPEPVAEQPQAATPADQAETAAEQAAPAADQVETGVDSADVARVDEPAAEGQGEPAEAPNDNSPQDSPSAQ